MILDTLAQSSRIRVEKAKNELPFERLKELIYDGAGVRSFNDRTAFAFERALRKQEIKKEIKQERKQERKQEVKQYTVVSVSAAEISFICEVKKASPSKGVISEDFPYLAIAKEYEKAGADAVSVLTEPEYFKGSNSYLSEISNAVHIPVLRKDFTVDEYQIYEAKLIGADAVLLICALLDTETIRKYLKICDELGLSALVEAHTEEEIASALNAGARVIGVNNRNLQTFDVDLSNSIRLRSMVPADVIFVAESGIRTAEDIRVLKKAGVNAVLIGETLMRSPDKKKELDILNSNDQ